MIVALMGKRRLRKGKRAHQGRGKGGKAERHGDKTFDRNSKRRRDLPKQARAGDGRSGKKSWRTKQGDGFDAVGRIALRHGLAQGQAGKSRHHPHRRGQAGR